MDKRIQKGIILFSKSEHATQAKACVACSFYARLTAKDRTERIGSKLGKRHTVGVTILLKIKYA